MREISVEVIRDAIARLCIEAAHVLPEDVRAALKAAASVEKTEPARTIMHDLVRNYELAESELIPICQDTGIACVFAEIGQEVHFVGGSLADAINEGVRIGYRDGFLRKSVVRDPLRRENTGDNTPASVHIDLVEGDKIRLTVAPKGFGSENMSAIKMLKPADGADGVVDFVVDTVERAGGNPCPPIVVGVGIGGTFEGCALLAKKALLRPLDRHHPDPYYAEMERELLKRINALGIGPQGFGGRTTALGVAIEAAPTHIASLPCAVNVGCHATRRKSVVL